MSYQKQNEYNKKHNRAFTVRFHRELESFYIEWLESKSSLKSYIKSLIDKDYMSNKRRELRNNKDAE